MNPSATVRDAGASTMLNRTNASVNEYGYGYINGTGYSKSNGYGNGYDYGTPSVFHRGNYIGRGPIGVESYPRRDGVPRISSLT